MTAQIIKFAPKPAKVAKPAPKRRRAPRLSPSIRALRTLDQDASSLACWMLWVGDLAKRGSDPRALASLIDEFVEDYLDNIDLSARFIADFAEAWKRRQARGQKPRPVR